jgi:hypothetical protein
MCCEISHQVRTSINNLNKGPTKYEVVFTAGDFRQEVRVTCFMNWSASRYLFAFCAEGYKESFMKLIDCSVFLWGGT